MKITLTSEQRHFLEKMGIAEERVFDASNMPTSTWRPLMRLSGALIASGVTPCKAHGHQFRGRHGHCVMCFPSTLVHEARHETDAYVYVAYSASEKLAKIGYTADTNDRIRQMNLHKTGMTSDWKILEAIHCKFAGAIEVEVFRVLKQYQVTVEYGAKKGASKELFRCGKQTALKALRGEVLKQNVRQFESLRLLLDVCDADQESAATLDPGELEACRIEYESLKLILKMHARDVSGSENDLHD